MTAPDPDDRDDHDTDRLLSTWRYSSDNARLLFLRELAIPFPANDPIQSAKNALANLTQLEWQDVCDWLSENHWLPPGC